MFEPKVSEVPEVNQRLAIWLHIWKLSIYLHYFLGIGGIACSTMAAAQWPTVELSRVAAIVAAIFFGIIGFVRPEQRYLGFIRAWRKLNYARAQYIQGQIDSKQLLEQMNKLEAEATEMELDLPQKREID